MTPSTTDTDRTARFDLEIPYQLGEGATGGLKFGFLFRDKTKDQALTEDEYELASGDLLLGQGVPDALDLALRVGLPADPGEDAPRGVASPVPAPPSHPQPRTDPRGRATRALEQNDGDRLQLHRRARGAARHALPVVGQGREGLRKHASA